MVTKKYDEAKTLFRKEQPKAIKFLKSSNRKITQKIYNIRSKKFLLRVIYKEIVENEVEVITAYLTTRIDKYLKR